ncbi:hypothetical protein JYQ62_19730 [Nostoc sp. UHCC 0702]|nr:hypothetical protein JYQ62_19730 [Nostoc sp. UHCC 0702]
MKQVVVPQAFMMLMEDFAAGDYGDLTPAFSEALTRGMCAPLEARYAALLEGKPVQMPALPPSSGDLTGTSSSTS